MTFANKTVLITGGSSGIGLGLAIRFLSAGSDVLITGRDKNKLEKVKADFPKINVFKNDLENQTEREKLSSYIIENFPELDILINNAGIQRRISLAEDNANWQERQSEIDILLSAPIHLNHLLIPLLLKGNKNSLIVNVTSGAAYIPMPFAPIYSACKAALHSYTLNLRYSLSRTNCRVVELIPPAVQTTLGGAAPHGVPLNEFCDSVFTELSDDGQTDTGFDFTDNLTFELMGKSQKDVFENNATMFPVKLYME
jgi:uncharacterized oxidoreductase